MTPSSNPADVAKGLSEAQRRVLCRGLRGNDTIATLRALKRKGLLIDYAARPTNGGWQPTPLGLAVRAHLTQEPHHDG